MKPPWAEHLYDMTALGWRAFPVTDLQAGLCYLAELCSRGFAVRMDGERLYLSPAAELQPADREEVAQRKGQLVMALHAATRGHQG